MTILAWGRIVGPSGVTGMSARRFAAQLDWLQDAALPILGLEAAVGRPGAGVALSLDGGHREIYTKVLPLLLARGMAATAYVPTAAVTSGQPLAGGGPPLTWPMIRELADAGWQVGSHGLRQEALAGLGDDALRRSLRDSRAALEDALGVRCRHFAPPAGELDGRLLDEILAAGYATVAVGRRGPRGGRGVAGVVRRAHIAAATPWWLFRARARGWDGRLGGRKGWILGRWGSRVLD